MKSMMINCLAIDDEPLALRQLTSNLQKVPFFNVVGSCQSAMEAMRMLEEEAVDAIFIDINMPDLNGMEFVKSLHHPPMVVFATAYLEYAVDGYKVDALDYLLKPYGMADIMRAAERVKRQYEMMHTAAVSYADEDDAIFLKTDYKVVRIIVSDIIYIEGMAEYLRFHLTSQDKPLITLLSMKKMEERLQAASFMRVHKSYIINLRHIAEVNKSRVILDDGVSIPIGDSYRERLTAYINGKFLGKGA